MILNKKFIASSILLTVVIFCLPIVLTNYNENRLAAAQTDPEAVAKAFTLALLHNDRFMLENLTTPHESADVANWMATHRPYFCRPSLDYPLMSQDIYVNLNHQDADSASFGSLYYCRIDGFMYGRVMQVYQVTLIKRGNTWYIDEWSGSACESNNIFAGCG